MQHIMSTGKKTIQIVTVACLKDSVCNSIQNLQPPAAGKHPSLTILHAMVFWSFTCAARKL